MHPALFSSCRMKCIFCIPPSVCRAKRSALPRRALAGRFRTRNPAAQSMLTGCSPRRMSLRCAPPHRPARCCREGFGGRPPRLPQVNSARSARVGRRRRAGGQDTERCMPPDMYICAAGCRIPHDENRILNAESLALARIRPDAAAFPVRRACMKSKIRKRKMQQPYSHFMPAARMKPALIYEGSLAAVRTGLPPCGHMCCALTAAYAGRRCAYIDARRRSDADIRRARGRFGRLRPTDGLERAADGAARVPACGGGVFRIGRRVRRKRRAAR